MPVGSRPHRLTSVPTQGGPPLHPPFPCWSLAVRRPSCLLSRLPAAMGEAAQALGSAPWAVRHRWLPAAAPPDDQRVHRRPLELALPPLALPLRSSLRHLTLTSLLPFEPGGLDPVAPEGPTSARCSPRGGSQGEPKALSAGDAAGALDGPRRGVPPAALAPPIKSVPRCPRKVSQRWAKPSSSEASLRSLTVKPLHTRMARRRFTVVYR